MPSSASKMKPSQVLLTIAAFVVVVAGMKASVNILVPFLLAVFIAIIGAAPLFWLQRKGLPSWLALLIVILIIFIIGFIIVTLVGSSVKDFSNDLPIYQEKFKQQTIKVIAWLGSHGVKTSNLGLEKVLDPGAAMKLVSVLLNSLGNVLTNGFLIGMTVIFILLEASSFPAKLQRIMGGTDSSLSFFDSFIDNVKQYMAIKTIVSLATGILVTILTAVLGVDYAVLWGMLAFAMNYVPNIGSIIAAIPTVLLTVIQLGVIPATAVAGGYLAINIVIGSVIEPRFMGRGLGLSTLVVFLSLIFWGWVLGPVGMLLSVPLTITAKIALDSSEETRWLAILLGPEVATQPDKNAVKETEIQNKAEKQVVI